MIQRIQSLWLFLASMLNGLLFLFPLYRYNVPNQVYSPWQLDKVTASLPLMIVAGVTTLLPLVTIFMFKDRKRQRGLIWITILSCFTLISLVLMRMNNLRNATPPAANLEYVLPGILVTFAAIFLLILALRGIRKDEQLIRSMDRLR